MNNLSQFSKCLGISKLCQFNLHSVQNKVDGVKQLRDTEVHSAYTPFGVNLCSLVLHKKKKKYSIQLEFHLLLCKE